MFLKNTEIFVRSISQEKKSWRNAIFKHFSLVFYIPFSFYECLKKYPW